MFQICLVSALIVGFVAVVIVAFSSGRECEE